MNIYIHTHKILKQINAEIMKMKVDIKMNK